MKKLFKTVMTLLAAAVCLMGVGVEPARAEESDVSIIYANVPEDWQNPCVWAWGEDGTNAFEAWPGGSMTADEGNPGWYYIYVPGFISSVIVNANEGTVQTTDLASGSADCWITVTSAEEAELTNEKLTEGELPENVATFKVNAYLPEDWTLPCLWAWLEPDGTNAFANWPGQELEQSADGWYSFSVPAWVNSVIINGNAGAVQTSDISVEPRDLWIVVEDSENYELSYEKPEIAGDMITVHAKMPSDWLMPCLWAWSAPDGTNVFANWPGEEMVLDGDWYTYSIPAWVNSIIINGNLGGIQTNDISIEPKDFWVIVSGDGDGYEVFYEEPSEEPADEPSDEPAVEQEPEATPTADASQSQQEPETDKGSNTVIYVIVAVAAAAAIAVGAVVVSKKKKK